ncbi:competence protein CoiA [Rhizosphaericola mali]|uniref:Competence protein CoiA nuclease-like domain-containing protein n=1 Tax=Rhizosphaericola mali TaxID=2545455 RepID=A0A5P2G4J8_9BACT|nr:competence protein CoiA family protein [Rhizosphaericola mali]QES88690.1 hypothetical protein E0W69_008510 [Rhizosphaericola mali]
MRYAKTDTNPHSEVEYPKQRGTCPCCDSIVIGHNGEFKIKHWQHYKRADCDSWFEPITEWHLSWQNNFPIEYQEVYMENNGKKHRADIKLPNGIVIEIQNSPISPIEIEERENFYGVKNLIWVINGETLCKNSKLNNQFVKKEFSISINIPYSIDENPGYQVDEFMEKILSIPIMKELIHKSCNYEINNGDNISLAFEDYIDINDVKLKMDMLMGHAYIEMYGKQTLPFFKSKNLINTCMVEYDHFIKVNLEKKHWRKFLDMMKYPLFIDNLQGLDSDYIYYYQKAKIISKKIFLKKYKNYCK